MSLRLTLTRHESPTNLIAGYGAPPCTPLRIYHLATEGPFVETVLAGSKRERGDGGFEVLAYPGPYRLDALGQVFTFEAQPGTTLLTFTLQDDPEPEPEPEPEPGPIDPFILHALQELHGDLDLALQRLHTLLEELEART